MIDKHEVLDLFIKSVCRLQGWPYSDINSHIEEIAQITVNKIHGMKHYIRDSMPNKKFLIATELLKTLDDEDVLLETLMNAALILASNTWEEYETLTNKVIENSVVHFETGDTPLDFETIIRYILKEKKP